MSASIGALVRPNSSSQSIVNFTIVPGRVDVMVLGGLLCAVADAAASRAVILSFVGVRNVVKRVA